MDGHSKPKPANSDSIEFLIIERTPRHRLIKISGQLWRKVQQGTASDKDIDHLSNINDALDMHFPKAANVTLR